jgi:hypothetical protein
MTHVRRLAASLCVLFASLLLSSGAFAADLKAAMEYVPADAFAVMALDAVAARSSPLVTESMKLLMSDDDARRELGELRTETGFDPLQHIDGLVVAVVDAKDSDDKVVAIGEVTIDEAKVIAFAKKKGTKVETKRGAGGSYYLLDGDTAVAFRGKHVIVSGPVTIERALKKKGPKASLKSALAQNEQRTFFFAVEPNREMKKDLERESKELGTLKLVQGGVDLGSGFDGTLLGKLASAAAARRAADFFNAQLTEAKQSREMQMLGLGQILGKIVIGAKGSDVTVSLALSNDEIRSLMATLRRLLAMG